MADTLSVYNKTINFSTEIPVYDSKGNTVDEKTLMIIQSKEKIEISVVTQENVYEVASQKIKGLPQDRPIPLQFFESCIARVLGKDDSATILFKTSDTKNDSQIQCRWPNTSLDTIPNPGDIKDLSRFYKDQLCECRAGTFGRLMASLPTLKETILNGATGVNIAFLSVSNFGYAAKMQVLKNDYREFTQSLFDSFCEIQANNIRILRSIATTNGRLPSGDTKSILLPMNDISKIADTNVNICQNLRSFANKLNDGLKNSLEEFGVKKDMIEGGMKDVASAQTYLDELKQKIENLENEIGELIEQQAPLEGKQTRATFVKYASLGLYPFLGGKTDFKEDRKILEEKIKRHKLFLEEAASLERKSFNDLLSAKEKLIQQLNIVDPNMRREDAEKTLSMAVGYVCCGLERIISELSDLSSIFDQYRHVTIINKEQTENLGQVSLDTPLSVDHFLNEFRDSSHSWIFIAALSNNVYLSLDTARKGVFKTLQLKEPDFNKHLDLARQELRMGPIVEIRELV